MQLVGLLVVVVDEIEGCELIERAKMAVRRRSKRRGGKGGGWSKRCRQTSTPPWLCCQTCRDMSISMTDDLGNPISSSLCCPRPVGATDLVEEEAGRMMSHEQTGIFQKKKMASFEDLSSTLTQHPSADTFWNVESFPSGRAALDMCDVAPTRSSPRSINHICSLLLGPASEPPRESRRPRCPPISPDGKRPISFPHHGFLEMESRWPAQTDADDCRKTEWGFHLFSFLGAALHVLADLGCIFGFGSWPMQHGICGNLSEQALPCCLSVLTVLPLPSILSGNDASPEHPSLLSCADRAHTDDGVCLARLTVTLKRHTPAWGRDISTPRHHQHRRNPHCFLSPPPPQGGVGPFHCREMGALHADPMMGTCKSGPRLGGTE